MPIRFHFSPGQPYTRRDVFREIGIPEGTRGGNWFTGYRKHSGAYFIFTNVGTPGRTGHDYHNAWEGARLRWFGKTSSRLSHPTIQGMLQPRAEVHLFWRGANDQPFLYAGTAHPVEVKNSVPVEILWTFEIPAADAEYRSADEVEGKGFREGAVREVTVNAYERSAEARTACIAYYGPVCRVCEVNFEERYGALGRGFIHVHHLVPLAQVGDEYELDPVRDLRPVCPNCHAMLHRAAPPLSVEQLR